MIGSTAGVLALAVLGSLGLSSQAAAQQEAPIAFIERLPTEGEVWIGTLEQVELRFGIRADVVEEGLVSVYRRELDLPVRLDLSDWSKNFDTKIYPQLDPEATGKSLVMNGEMVRLVPFIETRNGVEYESYTLPVLVEHATAMTHHEGGWRSEGPPVKLILHYASEFEEDFLGDRIAVNPQRLEFSSEPLVREVKETPPSILIGVRTAKARGPWELEARIDDAELSVGDEFTVEVEVRGEYLTSFDLLEPEGAGWVWLGSLESDRLGEPFAHTLRYRFDGRAERAGSWTLPPFRILRFAPESEQYLYDKSNTLSLTVQGTGPAAEVGDEAETSEPEETVEEEHPTATQPLPAWIPALLGAGLLALAAWARQTMRQNVATREAQAFERIERAAAAQEQAIEPLQIWLAARLDWPRARLSGPGTARRLQQAGIEAALAEQAAAFLREAEAARYGGPALADAAPRRETLRSALDAATKI